MHDYWNSFSQQMKPRVHEISAYLIALSFCWLLAFHREFRQGFLMFVTGFYSMSPFFVALGLIMIGGLCLSIFHVFTKRKKSVIEKFLMGWFIFGTSSIVSFALGSEMLLSRSPTLIIFPIWNIIMSIVLLVQMAANKYILLDEDASLAEVIVATVFLLAILIFSDRFIHFSWAMTLSFCIFYSTTIVFLIPWIIKRIGVKIPITPD